MTNGPIEFLKDTGPEHKLPATEMGGADGIIQPEKVDGVDAHVDLTAREAHGVLVRAAGLPLVGSERWTGESLTGELIQDPVSGRFLPDDQHQDIEGKTGREVGLSKGMIQSDEV